ncbi:hypothetical protein BB561_005587 [Smittium simulii]|uniref:Uncharacterized protein n=1 Tax=Smittium simulii TaxID=133385 RepID=A0A2T9Y9N9_9FUNG|nr:hypothetical protein BB561_005587 [Smittium simulii]
MSGSQPSNLSSVAATLNDRTDAFLGMLGQLAKQTGAMKTCSSKSIMDTCKKSIVLETHLAELEVQIKQLKTTSQKLENSVKLPKDALQNVESVNEALKTGNFFGK